MILRHRLLAALAAPALVAAAPAEPPRNVVLVLLDDVGTDFLPMYAERNPYQGAPPDAGPTPLHAEVPNLEALAADGVTFLDAYAMPRCSPTRASIYTGVYPSRHGIGDIVSPGFQGDLREFGDPGYEHQTLAELVRSVGYADFLSGKWHLGMPDALMDESFGSDCYLGWSSIPLRGGWSEWSCTFRGIDNTPIPDPEVYGLPGYYNYYVSEGQTDHAQVLAHGPTTEYATTLQFQRALDWCLAQQDPFLCVVSLNAAHSPWSEPPPSALVNTPGYLTGAFNAFTQHAAMIEAIDTELGRFLDGLGPGLRTRTTVIVMGDNGSPDPCLRQARQVGQESGVDGSAIDLGPVYDALLDAPQPRFKGSVFEKGTLVPLIVGGAGIGAPGRSSRALVDATDLFPTIAELIGAAVGPIQGVSFAPVLEAPVGGSRDFVFTEFFTPLGSTDDEANFNTRQVACSLRIADVGRYKVVRDAELGADLLYQLEDAAGEPLDRWELAPLDYGPGEPSAPYYELVRQKLEEVLAQGAGIGGPACGHVERFCDALANSTGEPGRMDFEGSRGLCAKDLQLRADTLPPNQAGVFFYSASAVELPFGEGLACVGGATVRLHVVPILPNGKAFYWFDAQAAGFAPGEVRNFQMWYRDPAGGPSGFNFTDALALTFCH